LKRFSPVNANFQHAAIKAILQVKVIAERDLNEQGVLA
jgi:hypothetical protein